MPKILHVSGDDDYGALTFEQSHVSLSEAFELAEENGGTYETEIDNNSVNYKSFEFGEVDPKFIDFIFEHMTDYDDAKHTQFYVLPERGAII